MTHRLGFLAQRLFNTPLALAPDKAEVIVAALAERFGIARINGRDAIDAAAVHNGTEFALPGRVRAYDVVEGVALIPVEGTLVQKLGVMQPYSGMTGYDGIRQMFLSALVDEEVRAIVFDISSPGGEVAGCMDLVDTIRAARGIKPMWSILDECAYSAGYAIASAADRITVPRTGGVGSIGCIAMHVDWSKALSNSGLAVTLVTFGDRKADGAPQLPLSPEARAAYQRQIDLMGEIFVETVARNRNLPAQSVRDQQAALYHGADGVKAGLADAVSAPDAAFSALLDELGASTGRTQ